ncbi:MAG: DUF4097 family beta strand repeat-containing protein, partial [Gemmatimonadales bacterium]
LKVDNFGGEIVVRTWSEARVRVRAEHSSRTTVGITVGSTVVSVTTEGRRGPPQLVDFQLTVPTWMPLNLSGVYTDISLEGVQATVSAETVEGDVTLQGGSGTVTLQSVEGDVTVTGARGRIDVHSVDGTIQIGESAADIVAETVDGDIMLHGIDAASVEASTVDGDIRYDGAMRDEGRYSFATHDGDIDVAVPERANVTGDVQTFSGTFEATFPVQISEIRKGRRFSFTLGRGTGRLELQSFDGDITLRRPGEVTMPERDKHDKDHDKEKEEHR